MDKCCVCGEKIEGEYVYTQRQNDKSRLYIGHKRCLFEIPTRLENGEEFEYMEFERKETSE